MMTRYVICLILLLTAVNLLSQVPQHEMKIPVGAKEKQELLTELKTEVFFPYASCSYNIASNDLVSSLSRIKDVEPKDEAYLKKLEAALKKDSLNFWCYNNLADYYSFTGNTDQAISYFKQALVVLKPAMFNSDTASYYALRGVVRFNIGDTNAIADIEKALVLNPTDSLALAFYPLFLFNKKEYTRVRTLCTKALDTDNKNPSLPYLFLILNEIFESINNKAQKVYNNDSMKVVYRNTTYTNLVDMTLLDKYAKRYQSDTAVVNARHMADVFVLMIKMIFFKETEDHRLTFAYTKEDIKKLEELEHFFETAKEKRAGLNDYTIYKNIGVVCFMLQKWDKSLKNLEKAIEVFPQSKAGPYFNTGGEYDFMQGVYYMNKQTSEFESALRRKINAEPGGRKVTDDYIRLAKLCLQNDRIDEAATLAKDIDEKNFDALCIQSHVYFMKGFTSLSELYGKEASKYMRDNTDQSKLLIQFGIYFLMLNNPDTAYGNIEGARQSFDPGKPCELCDKLEQRYLKVKQ